jgi:hypothetical protein
MNLVDIICKSLAPYTSNLNFFKLEELLSCIEELSDSIEPIQEAVISFKNQVLLNRGKFLKYNIFLDKY